MATIDLFADVDGFLTGAATTIDRRAAHSAAFLVVTGTSASALDLEESDDDSSWANIGDDDLRFVTAAGVDTAGKPTVADDEVYIVRYVGEKRYLRGSGTNITVHVLTSAPARGAQPQTDI